MANNTQVQQEQLRQEYAKDKSHHLKNGRFTNPWLSFTNPPSGKFIMHLVSQELSNPALSSVKEGRVPEVVPLDQQAISQPGTAVQMTWLGHASLLVQLDGATILCDPVFSQRCSPSQLMGPKRYTKAPCTVQDLPHIDALVLSHNHYDHLDWNTLKALVERDPQIKVFAPLGNRQILTSIGFTNISIADWWDEFSLPIAGGNELRLACTPAQHMTGRGLLDRMATLWSSWVFKGPSASFFFSGDTAYSAIHANPTNAECPAFKQIGSVYGPFDLAAIAIGAYGPEAMFSGMHANPEQAVRIHEDVGSKKSVGIHWGTFILTTEPVDEPPRRLRDAMKAAGHSVDDFSVLKIGQTTSGAI
ncbi:Protein-lysine N-methyltransferase efm4 [Coemansia sp. RSA 1933]|nr:Protein-lysine N-methyltransferase efm4 [Coemansia sp. RSA 1933]